DASDDLTLFGVIATAPPHDPFPAELQGRPVVLVAVCHIGETDVAGRELAPLRELGPAADLVGPMPFTAVQSMIDETAPHGRGNHSGAVQLPELSDEVIADVLAAFTAVTSPFGH